MKITIAHDPGLADEATRLHAYLRARDFDAVLVVTAPPRSGDREEVASELVEILAGQTDVLVALPDARAPRSIVDPVVGLAVGLNREVVAWDVYSADPQDPEAYRPHPSPVYWLGHMWRGKGPIEDTTIANLGALMHLLALKTASKPPSTAAWQKAGQAIIGLGLSLGRRALAAEQALADAREKLERQQAHLDRMAATNRHQQAKLEEAERRAAAVSTEARAVEQGAEGIVADYRTARDRALAERDAADTRRIAIDGLVAAAIKEYRGKLAEYRELFDSGRAVCAPAVAVDRALSLFERAFAGLGAPSAPVLPIGHPGAGRQPVAHWRDLELAKLDEAATVTAANIESQPIFTRRDPAAVDEPPAARGEALA